MNKTKKMIPKLRFPEFSNDEEWQKTTIDKIAKVSAGGTPESTNPEYWNGNIPWMNSGELNNKRIYSVSNYITSKGLKESSTKLIPPNCVLIGLAGQGKTRGTAAINYIELCTNQSIGSIHPNEDVFDSEFLYQKVDSMYEKLRYLSAGDGGRGGLNLQIIKEIELSLPKLKEQQKVAACLSSLDEVIVSHNQKLQLLRDHKKGLMQTFFPREGEKVPKYRFKEFKGEWVKKKLGEVATFINGRAYKQEELLDGGKYRVLRVGNFFTNNNWYYSNLELEEDKYCDNGDLLYAWSASFGPRIWKGEKVIYHYHIWKVVPSQSIDKGFLFILLDNETERMKTQNANGFALLHITKGTIESWKCCIPKSKDEQQKIASCLSDLDELINAQAEKIEQLKLHKKGLMQSLFPQMKD
ncbi:restriction endonuclease subunit S [Taibaiella helva]|uniref:restriction endonuclease subunit S n=1 Tax=Taibaiella helva TaxID=2301235 RepID=UPI000E5902B9|nr:restriction endonuclease subunit S [Taibaiella helva]